jgi:hypothetical protein
LGGNVGQLGVDELERGSRPSTHNPGEEALEARAPVVESELRQRRVRCPGRARLAPETAEGLVHGGQAVLEALRGQAVRVHHAEVVAQRP